MHYKISHCIGLLALALSSAIYAKPIQGIEFSHNDWELVCSNTGTCQAAGYQEFDGNEPVSLLLVRKAGAKQAVRGQVAIADFGEEYPANSLKNIRLYIDDKDQGLINGDFSQKTVLDLSQPQVDAILKKSRENVSIVLKNQHYHWQVSSDGMTAVLLKMDDFQKRVGTTGALVKKGTLDESKVLAAQPKFVVKHVKTPAKPIREIKPDQPAYQKMLERLMTATSKDHGDDCSDEYWKDDPRTIQLYRLNDQQQIATMLCWRGAYNEGLGVWLLDNRSGVNQTQLITDQATEFNSGEIYGSQRGRGPADCIASYQWIWDGQKFVQTLDRWSGKCRGLALGGVWELDRIEAIVK